MVAVMDERIRIIIDTTEEFRAAVKRRAQKLALELGEDVSPSDVLNALIAGGVDGVGADDVLDARQGKHNSKEIREAKAILDRRAGGNQPPGNKRRSAEH